MRVPGISDRVHLLAQYLDASNLRARAQLHQRYSTNPRGWQEWVYDQLDLPAGSRVLELGCGPGHLWQRNLERIPEGWQIVLSDFSPGMVQEAQGNLRACGRPFAFIVHDAQAIPFADRAFDGLIANHMLYCVADRARTFAEIRRVLRPAGRFYAATNGRAHMRELRQWHARFESDPQRWIGSVAESFTLENGAEQLAPWFSHISLCRQENSLHVTEAGPLIAYVASTNTHSEAGLQALAAYVERELAQHGAIHITKDSGMFEALRD